ncbi:MAG: hypothetical protein JWO71_727 [Candidatus Acidoferrum typicum]|nr:hypothetical protein [Candidatus Acidoferrum typicum]
MNLERRYFTDRVPNFNELAGIVLRGFSNIRPKAVGGKRRVAQRDWLRSG